MSSAKKIAANRANARKSTGPASRAGKQRSSKNARRHGLSIPIVADPVWSAHIEGLAEKIAGPNASPISLALAKYIAAAQADLMRARCARYEMLSAALAGVQPAKRERTTALSLSPKVSRAASREGLIKSLGRKLQKLDRYERRALSRRKRAIRAYDASLRATLKGRKSRFSVVKLNEW